MRLLVERSSISRTLLLLGSLAVGVLFGGQMCAASPTDDVLLIASSEQHVWLVVRDPAKPGTWRLMHHAAGMDGPYARVARTLNARPTAIAARGNEVLLAIPPQLPSGTEFDLLGIRVQQNPALSTYYDLPLDGWDIFAGIPHKEPLGGVAIGEEGPLALLLPAKQRSEGIRRTRGGDRPEPAVARLLMQSAYSWTEVELPEELQATSRQKLLPRAGLAEASILASGEDGSARLFTRSEETWSTRELGASWESIKRSTRYKDRLAYALEEDGTEKIGLALERGGTLLTVAQLDAPSEQWGLAAIGDSLLFVKADGRGQITVRMVDPIAGSLGDSIVWERPPLNVTEWLHLPIIGMLVVAALLAIVLFRPSEPPDLPILAGVVPLGLGRRLLALGIDLVPGVIVAFSIFDIDISRLSLIQFMTADVALAGPGSLVIGITIVHETISELLFDRSIGKRLCGGRVCASNGMRASRRAILLRCLFKAVVLYAPILAVFVLLSPARQGVPETVSRTVVADARARGETPTGE